MSAVAEPQTLISTTSPIAPAQHDSIAIELKMAIDPNPSTSSIYCPTTTENVSEECLNLESIKTDTVNPYSEQLPSTSHADNYENPASVQEDEQEETAQNCEKTKFLNVGQKKKFQEWIGQHSENLYPTRDEKLGLAKLLSASYLQVTRLLANHRRRLQLQRKRKPAALKLTDDFKDDLNSSGDKENRLDEENEKIVETTEAEKIKMEHLQSVVDEVSAPNRVENSNVDEETRRNHISELRCDESFEDLDEQLDLPKPAKLTLSERNKRIDSTIDQVLKYVNQLGVPMTTLDPKSKALSAQQLMPAPQTAANSEDSAPMVAEFHRRIAALIKIQDEMKAQSGFKELETNYVTPPPSVPLDQTQTTPMMNHPPSNTSIPTNNIPISSDSQMMRRPGSSITINGLPNSTQSKCDVSSIPQPLPPTSFASPLTQQQVMNAMGSLNLLPQQPPISQPPNLLPLIQKLLSGDFLTNRTPIIDEKLGMDQGSRPHQMQQTGTSLALNQLIGNNSTPTANVTPAQQLSPVTSAITNNPHNITDSNMLYPGIQATLNAFVASMAANGNSALIQAPSQQPTIPTSQTVAELLQQALIRQQQQSFLSLLQNRDSLAKLGANTASLTPDFLGVNGCSEKAYGLTNPQPNAPSHLMSPPLSSNSSNSPRLFSNEPPFSDISTCSNSPAPIDSTFLPSTQATPPVVQPAFATPPSTGKSVAVKAQRKSKKQLRMEAENNGENFTPIAVRKRQTNEKSESLKGKKARVESASRQKLSTSSNSTPIVPRKINELTENESIAVAVLAGLANGRFS